MPAERIIGIDFGTSTSVIRVKRYLGGKPAGDGGKLDTKEVIFGNQPTVPTVISYVGENAYYGYDALVPKKHAEIFQGFKVRLESTDEEEKRQARLLTAKFMNYLAKVYREQSDGGHLGEADDIEHTFISYPVKWSEETKRFMCETAAQAGFIDVHGMDEAQAAIRAVIWQSEGYLRDRGYLISGEPCTMLLIDMGAGTTDLVFCRYTPGENPIHEILCTWPKEEGILFGGQEVDTILREYLRKKLPEEEAEKIVDKLSSSSIKHWKERIVSPALQKKLYAEDFSELEAILDILGLETRGYGLDRASFEALAGEYLQGFVSLLQGGVREAGISPEDVDLVILTGGHSQWYFVKELLTGSMSAPDSICFSKIRNDPGRIVPTPRPQETVALGLVFAPITDTVVKGRQEQEVSEKLSGKVSEGKDFAQDNRNQDTSVCSEGSLVTEFMKSLHEPPRGNGLSELSPQYIRRARDYYGMSEEDTILYTYHTDAVDSLTIYPYQRFYFTTEGFYGREATSVGKIVFLPWARFADIQITKFQDNKGGMKLFFDGKPVNASPSWKETEAWYQFYQDLRQYLKNGKSQSAPDGENRAVSDGGVKDAANETVRQKKDKTEILADYYTTSADSHITARLDNGQMLTAFLQPDGRIITEDPLMVGWNNLSAIARGRGYVVGVSGDGRVIASGNNIRGQCDVRTWKNVKSVQCGVSHTVGLCRDGTVLAVGANDSDQCDVTGWTQIREIACGTAHTVGLREDGTVVAAGGKLSLKCFVSGWKNVIAIACGEGHTVGLRKDGTVIATGYNLHGECEVSGWKDIIAVICGEHYTVGLRKNGMLALAGCVPDCVAGWHNMLAVVSTPSVSVHSGAAMVLPAFGQNQTEGLLGIKKDGTILECIFTWNGFGKIDPTSVCVQTLPWKLF
ncbi:MAG: Hsp70 family protein [Lachnospiraceae bacterium]|nr:Hsp70 family protein [Lachnospiraceae bacterium]